MHGTTEKDDRYTYLEGSTSGGLSLYDDKFAYSHHGTDPVGDKLSNAFDLVRIHKFGEFDEDVKENTLVNKYPSFKMISEFALEDDKARILLAQEKISTASEIFDEWEDDDREWVAQLAILKCQLVKIKKLIFQVILIIN